MNRRNLLLSAVAAFAIGTSDLGGSYVLAQTSAAATGVYTYPGPGTVNTHWIE